MTIDPWTLNRDTNYAINMSNRALQIAERKEAYGDRDNAVSLYNLIVLLIDSKKYQELNTLSQARKYCQEFLRKFKSYDAGLTAKVKYFLNELTGEEEQTEEKVVKKKSKSTSAKTSKEVSNSKGNSKKKSSKKPARYYELVEEWAEVSQELIEYQQKNLDYELASTFEKMFKSSYESEIQELEERLEEIEREQAEYED
jgi:hypothetical protein